MSDLHLGSAGRPTETVFGLLGRDEDDLTRALAWTLSRSDRFLRSILNVLNLPFATDPVHRLTVQLPKVSLGRTDIEVEAAEAVVVFEAKLGWNLPWEEQVAKYEKRVAEQIAASEAGNVEQPVRHGAIVTLSECSHDWATRQLPAANRPLPLRHLTWAEVITLAEGTAHAGGRLHERQLLRDLAAYLRSTTTMRDEPASEMTWLVPISQKRNPGSRLNFLETVQAGWYYDKIRTVPKAPFNFIAFSWRGALHEIRYVEDRSLFSEFKEALPDIYESPLEWGEHWLFQLGPPIKPPQPLPYGKPFYAPHKKYRALLDCLLTSQTVAEAIQRSHQRFADAGLPF